MNFQRPQAAIVWFVPARPDNLLDRPHEPFELIKHEQCDAETGKKRSDVSSLGDT